MRYLVALQTSHKNNRIHYSSICSSVSPQRTGRVMSRSAVNAKPYPPVATYSNRVSGHRDIDSSVSVKSRLRSNRHSQDIALTAAETQQANKDSHRQNSPADVSQTVEETPTHRVRQDTAVHTHDLSDGPAFSHRHSESPPLSALVEPVSQICLCQPEPKIPRPRNGTQTIPSPSECQRF